MITEGKNVKKKLLSPVCVWRVEKGGNTRFIEVNIWVSTSMFTVEHKHTSSPGRSRQPSCVCFVYLLKAGAHGEVSGQVSKEVSGENFERKYLREVPRKASSEPLGQGMH